MAKVTIKTPNILVFEFLQEPSDLDYGSCLWARFTYDCDNYDLHISSDRGEFGYSGWVPTPSTESFLELLSKISSDYLLSKLADPSTIDVASTYKNIRELLMCECAYTGVPITTIDMDSIYTACTYSTETDIVLGISSALEEYPDIQEVIAEYTLYEYIVTDYSPDAKYIVHIFENFIAPQIKNILKETNYNELHE